MAVIRLWQQSVLDNIGVMWCCRSAIAQVLAYTQLTRVTQIAGARGYLKGASEVLTLCNSDNQSIDFVLRSLYCVTQLKHTFADMQKRSNTCVSQGCTYVWCAAWCLAGWLCFGMVAAEEDHDLCWL